MKRGTIGMLAVCVGLIGCRGEDRSDDKTAEVRPTTVTETGCLTARGDQFVLTDLERGEGQATTETFQLIGSEADLRQHVGQQVRVSGEAEAPKIAVVQESTPPSPQPTPQGTAGGVEPKVRTQEQTRVEVRKLKVASVQPTGASCAEETRPQ